MPPFLLQTAHTQQKKPPPSTDHKLTRQGEGVFRSLVRQRSIKTPVPFNPKEGQREKGCLDCTLAMRRLGLALRYDLVSLADRGYRWTAVWYVSRGGEGGGGVKHRRFGDEFIACLSYYEHAMHLCALPAHFFSTAPFPIDLTLESALMNHDDGAVPGPETFEWSSPPALARGGGGATQSGRNALEEPSRQGLLVTERSPFLFFFFFLQVTWAGLY